MNRIAADDDDTPAYSALGLNTIHEFHDSTCMLYVEGQDDVIFWEAICERAGIAGIRIEDVGGRCQLEEYVERITTDNAEVIVACDSDYERLLNETEEHPLIVRTYGYSIENTMYCPPSLNRFVRKLARSRRDYTRAAQDWLDSFCVASRPLLIHDLANHVYSKGIGIMDKTCSRFLTGKNSDTLCSAKIRDFLEQVSVMFQQSELDHSETVIASVDKPLRALVKGHFLTLGVANWLKKHVPKSVTISNEHIYTTTVDCCRACAQTGCEQLHEMTAALRNAVEFANSCRG